MCIMKSIPKGLLLGNYKLDKDSKYVCLKKMLNSQEIDGNLVVPLGVTEDNKYHYMGLDDVSCLLITGETGSGKSIFLDAMIISLILRNSPEEVKFIMIDPKRIELSYYNDLEYMHSNVVSKAKTSYMKLLEVQREYDKRWKILEDKDVKSIKNYNSLKNIDKLSHLFVIVDESCDLMKVEGAEQVLRELMVDCDKVGIHIILATNSYSEEYFSKDFIRSLEYKITFDLVSRADAILVGTREAEDLKTPGEAFATSKKQRIKYKLQTPYISDTDIMRVIEYYSGKGNMIKK